MIDLTLDSLTVPGIPDYEPPFGTVKDPLVSLSTVETNNNIIKPFTAQRAVEFSHDEEVSRIERNACLVFTGDENAVLDLSDVTTFKGNELKVVNTTSHALTIKYMEVGESSFSTVNLVENIVTFTADSNNTYSIKVSVESESITTLWSGTKEQFDAIPVKDSNTLYNIIDDVDEELIQDDKISPNSTWSSERIVEKINKLKKNIILIGDSYGTLYRANTTTIPEEIEPLLTKNGINFYHKFVSGAGFSNGMFLSNLQSLASSIEDKNSIDEIWVFGGWNDEIGRNSQTVEGLIEAMKEFRNYAQSLYSKAQVKLSFISFGFKIITNTEDSQAGYELRGLKQVLTTYSQKANTVGISYVKGLESVCHNRELMEPHDGVTDAGHPNDAGVRELAARMADLILVGSTNVQYKTSGIRSWGDSENLTLAPGVTTSSADRWYWFENIYDYMYRFYAYIVANTNSAPVFNFGTAYQNITLNCALIKFGYWKAQLGIPISENVTIEIPAVVSVTFTGSSTPTLIHCNLQFIYMYEEMNGDGRSGYSVLFRLPYLPNSSGVTTGKLNYICITGSATLSLDTRMF